MGETEERILNSERFSQLKVKRISKNYKNVVF